MKLVVQRVSSAKVEIEGKVSGEIGRGLLLLICAMADDQADDAEILIEKILKMRTFENPETGKIMDMSVIDLGLEVLVVSQFTLAGTFLKGKRPDFTKAMNPTDAKKSYEYFVESIKQKSGLKVETGEFGANMQVSLQNDGPVTYILDSKDYV